MQITLKCPEQYRRCQHLFSREHARNLPVTYNIAIGTKAAQTRTLHKRHTHMLSDGMRLKLTLQIETPDSYVVDFVKSVNETHLDLLNLSNHLQDNVVYGLSASL